MNACSSWAYLVNIQTSKLRLLSEAERSDKSETSLSDFEKKSMITNSDVIQEQAKRFEALELIDVN